MNRVARKGLVTAMVAGGVLASAGAAQADSAAGGVSAGSPGVLSGNSVQVPVHVPVNVCGNTVDVVGLLNPAMGNTCANTSSAAPTTAGAATAPRGAGPSATAAGTGRHAGKAADESGDPGSRSSGGAHAADRTAGSPGVLSGNSLQLPVDVPINISGNSVNVVGIGNPASGNTAVNSSPPVRTTTPPPPAHQPVPAPPNEMVDTADASALPSLAHTGADGLGWTAGASAALLLGGALLYRRARPSARTAAAAGPVGAGTR
ncbi:putative secreted protein [Actinacidiphila reveromycinica]|uniref:Putative secreted protein n=1 Tax=Actinacidiphila reveromycinica TaxID=659352 RepID=A0A7U3VLU0_9ACTN|nr:chaplin [Streptomyces sp. SN-593]BBA95878.1 putative secreted protein [Streptomyces sp. SN-593]